ncbi:DNA starvation/stationary phase protection protein [Prolixibacteraceae bacterium JC049]|nr:DNA starvation/stationary phase protection protein [Prolixibacteraceae bacterium JC049]
MKTQELNIETKNTQVANQLNALLANYQIFYQNLRGLHWNVKGQFFFGLHAKYEELYNEAAEVIDELAERILMVGGTPLHTFNDYTQHASLVAVENISEGKAGLEAVLQNSRYLLGQFREILDVASENDDEGTVALMSDLIGSTEKRIWMLNATLS